MNREKFLNVYWRYYGLLEEDFKNTIRFVSLEKDNYETYSIEYARLLQAICSEIDVIFKTICNKDKGNINEYAKIIITKDKQFINNIVCLKMYNRGIKIKPFECWTENNPPEWWTAYNKIKHHRSDEMKKATMKNTLYAISGLFLLEQYLLHDIVIENKEEFFCVDYPSILFYIKKTESNI